MRTSRFAALSVAVLFVASWAAVIIVAVMVLGEPVPDTPGGRLVALITLTAGILGGAAPLQQIRTMLATESAEDVSVGFLGFLTLSFMAWLSYGIVLHDPVMWTVNTLGVALTGGAALVAWRLQRRGRAGGALSGTAAGSLASTPVE